MLRVLDPITAEVSRSICYRKLDDLGLECLGYIHVVSNVSDSAANNAVCDRSSRFQYAVNANAVLYE